ncbi:MAG: TlpA family protein disulfide reductase [Bacteroidota bacterium]
MKYLLIAALSLALISCQQQKPQTSITQTASAYKANVSILAGSEKTGEGNVPNFTWTGADGKVVSFAEVSKGRPVLVNFWATWCGPCVHEIPDLVALNEEYTAKGALIIGISADRDDDALTLVADFAKEKNMKYPIIIDNGDLEEAFGGLRGYPTTFYIDKNGKIVKKLIGLQSKAKFAEEFNAIL